LVKLAYGDCKLPELDRLQSAPRKSLTRRNVRILLILTIFNTLIILGIGVGTISDPSYCDDSILLDGDGTSYSDFHKSKGVAEEEVLARANLEAELLSAKKVSMYRCPGACPEKFSSKTTVNIRNIRPQFDAPPGEETPKWSASSSFVWYANLSCS
jgi:hypothetical protein